MKERVYAFGGTLHIKTGQGAGTQIEIQLPLATNATTKE
jgi:signal transduction histidine kinase